MKTAMKRVLAAICASTVVGLAAAGCGSSTSHAEPTITHDQVVGIVGPAPDTPAGTSYDGSAPTELSPADVRARAQNPSDRAIASLLEKAGLQTIYQRSFNGAVNTADATAYLFATASGASRALGGLRTSFKRQARPDRTVTEVTGSTIGDESWAAHLGGSGGEAAIYLARTANLVVVTDMSCDATCGFDVVTAVKTYAGEIAGRAALPAG
jgi:hypothetical protein